jgi:hypothetical protein
LIKLENRWLICAVVAALVLAGCRCNETAQAFNHDVIGKWNDEDLAISFYDDGVGSVRGHKFHWRPIDNSRVRLEVEDEIAEFVISQENNGDVTGSLVYGGAKLADFVSGETLKFKKERKAA